MPKAKNTVGRPLAVTPQVIAKLETAFSMGCTELEACLLAGICHSTLKNYQIKNPEFMARKKLLKENPVLKSRKVVIDALDNGDLDTAKWYLERKAKAEFSTRTESTGADGSPIVVSNVDHKALAKSMSKEERASLLEKLKGAVKGG